jgi:two-component system, cell cycle response regulator
MLANARTARFEVDWAQTYEDGLKRLLNGDYAACLLDYQLGGDNGLALLRQARLSDCQTPVIFLTAESADDIDEAAMEAGAADYLVKGEITPRLLERAIRYSLKLGEALRELRRLATRDALTGLLNRRAFDTLLAAEVDRSRRLGHQLALAIFDLDHFKAINDTHGHAAGDLVLAAAARTLESGVRSIDRVARIGGEELAVVLLETDGVVAVEVVQRLVAALRACAVKVASGAVVGFTASAGVAVFQSSTDTEADLLAAADEALYAAKGAGRDRVVLAS